MATPEIRIIELEEKLNTIIEQLNSIDEGTSKMSKHIDFIEGVYNTVSAPMYWVCDKINNMRIGFKSPNPKETSSHPVMKNSKLNRFDALTPETKFDIDSQD
jgi:hypothetical protein|tara:strand:+ start:187 stop:492 length:306 start_codon:yes stop_codon:yes gene_type:complete